MLNGAVANRYARALFEWAVEHKETESVAKALQALKQLLHESTEARDFLEHPLIPAEAKTEFLRNYYGETLPDVLYRFLRVLFHRRRASYLYLIAERVDKLVEAAAGIQSVWIETAQPLTEEHRLQMEQKLGEQLKKTVRAHVEIRPELVAGYRARLGNRVLDATVAGALVQFGQRVSSVSSAQ
ncbi:ATP synthase F1 subunit delta [Alicyclobacillus sp. SP_1]|uniref:ATP synthase F1 subunit delta n=1 Tax=Alicyclobacillus sp. SP_1 TaxID=2942475 RepID=UPI002157FD4B|nr:ATP synthase F1 subunit delta [Alicyclobacillus sp. SP_1]